MTTEIEEALTRSLHQGVAEPGWPVGDVNRAIAEGQRLRRRARLRVLGGVAAVAVLATAGIQALPDRQPTSRPAATPDFASGWTQLPDFPLTPRVSPAIAWLGDDLVVAGGSSSTAGNSECAPETCRAERLFDAAAYDFDTGQWRRIADVPEVADWITPLYEIGGTLVAGDRKSWYSYDIDGDAWMRLPDPPYDYFGGFAAISGSVAWGDAEDLAGHGGPDGQGARVVGSPLVSFDLDARTWAEAPTDGLSADFVRKGLFNTERGLVAAGIEPPGGADGIDDDEELYPLVSYLLEGGHWTELPDSGVRAARVSMLSWTGTRLVSDVMKGVPEALQPGPNFSLDVFTGESEPYDPPVDIESASGSWPVYAVETGSNIHNGVLYDLDTGESREIGRPDGAAADDFFRSAMREGLVYVAGGMSSKQDGRGNTSEVWVWAP